MPDFRLGLFTSAWDEVAWDLVKAVSQNFKVAFVFVSREEGETHFGDLMIRNVRAAGLPLVTFSSLRFEPELRKKDREAWRLEHDRRVNELVPSAELIVLLGYMWWFGEEMCRGRIAINLHPALPTGPKGNYREVIWQLIKERAAETGVMMHLVTPNWDRGPAIAFCRFSIRGNGFDSLWQKMEKRLETETLEEIAGKEGEDNSLFAAIRQKGVVREFPMVVEAIKAFQERRIRVDQDRILPSGCDLTEEINAAIKEKI